MQASLTRKDGLAEQLQKASPLRIHATCRRNYTRPIGIKACTSSSPVCPTGIPLQNQDAETPHLRSSHTTFDFKKDCLFCGTELCRTSDIKQPAEYKKQISEVRTMTFQNTVRCHAMERNDEWGQTVLGRVSGWCN